MDCKEKTRWIQIKIFSTLYDDFAKLPSKIPGQNWRKVR